ncbi:hypothetical protein [Sorangium sp. So ce590]|uniref:hypothetical protein n=1 Tax=unclassified Sorangium TaxID=2621164 RepID=UPI003F61E792
MFHAPDVLRRFALVLRVLVSTAGKDAFARAMPLYMGLGLAGVGIAWLLDACGAAARPRAIGAGSFWRQRL